MTKFQAVYSKRAERDLKKTDSYTHRMIYNWIDKNLNGCEAPRRFGKALAGDGSGLWRYRIGDYRLICHIEDSKPVILALTVGHRREVYKK